MKKLLLFLICSICFTFAAKADEASDVLAIFDKYVNDANAYSTNIPNYYTNNAKIVRVVNRKQGGQHSVIIPFDRYLKEMQAHSKLAKATGYKNRYENRKITKLENDYKVSATRIPRNDKIGLPSHFIFTKTGNTWKIKEESMTTNVQTFLNAKFQTQAN